MRRADFEKELRRMAAANRLPIHPPSVIEFAYAHEPAPDFQNVFTGAGRKAFLLVTGEATYAVRLGRLGRRRLRSQWIVRHSALVADAYYARDTKRRHAVDQLVLPLDNGTKVFAMGAGAELAQYNCEMAAWEINEVRAAGRTENEPVDPFAPQRAGAQALTAYQARDFSLSFLLYVEAIDRLHEAFVAGERRARRPSAGDDGLLDGLVEAHRALSKGERDETEAAFAHVVAQLREIADALGAPGDAPYAAAIRRLHRA
jgi:hypothetical protein